ncbi:MAG: HAD family hydrolase [Lachnospiraceae bacterium]|nr:HAD family hydrolase [Lachnospiraceae bacterium]
MIKMIASDLDGTLIPEGTQEMEDGFMDVLGELLERGYEFCAASGRQYANMRRVFEEYQDRIGFVCENGALVMEHGTIQYAQKLPRELVSEVAEDIMRFPCTDIMLSGVKACYIQPRTPWYENQITHVLKNETRVFQNFSEIDDTIVKIAMYVYDFPQNIESIRSFMEEKYGTLADFLCAGNDWFDMIMKGSGKGTGLRAYIEKKGIRSDEIMAFGDNQNDISMLELTPHSYAMAHSTPEVRSHAGHVCTSVTQTLRAFLDTELS